MSKIKNIVLVAHKYLPHPDEDLIDYLKQRKTSNVLHVKHSFSDAPDRKSIYDWYKKNRLYKKKETVDYKFLPEVAIYIKEFIYTLYWIITSKSTWDVYIGMDGLMTFFGIIFRKLGYCKKVIYWSIDFVPEKRFEDSWKNKIYNAINIFSYTNSDENWDLSPRMASARKKYFNISNVKKPRIVPFGVWTKDIKQVPYKSCEKNSLIFMGHLISEKGVGFVIDKIVDIVKVMPNFKFKIIGDGSHKQKLVAMAKQKGVINYCNFLGQIKDSGEMIKEIAKSAVAIAPYPKTSYARWADPGKVKTYLAAGVPVLVTDVPWNAKEIQEKRCGLIIKYDGEDLVEKLMFLMGSKMNGKFRKNAIKYSKNFGYGKIFSRLSI